MKTTLNISDPLLDAAKKLAREQNTTVRALVEEGLRQVIAGRTEPAPFRLRDRSFGGEGLQPEFKGTGWEAIRNAIYRDQGG